MNEKVELITSNQNPYVKHFRQLTSSARFRKKENQTVLHGVHLVDSCLLSGGAIDSVAVTTTSLMNTEVAEILNRALVLGVPVKQLPPSLDRLVSGVDNGLSVAAVMNMPKVTAPETVEESAILLDRIQDPGNIGSILRVAAAAGIKKVFCSEGTTSAWSPKSLRAGMGAQFNLEIYEHVNLKSLLSISSVPVYATSLEGKRSIYDLDLVGANAWLFGNEGQGLDEDLLGSGVEPVIIPQDNAVESLNVATAVAVCLFEQRRQNLS